MPTPQQLSVQGWGWETGNTETRPSPWRVLGLLKTVYGHIIIAHRISDAHVGRKLPAGNVPLWIVVLFNKAVGLEVQTGYWLLVYA